MLLRFAKKGLDENIQIKVVGTENVRNEAKWGPGVRDVYILHYVLAGKGYFNGNLVKKDQGFFIKANEIAHYYYDKNDPWQYFWIMFSGSKAEELCTNFLPLDEGGIFNYDFSSKICDLIPKLFSTDGFMAQSEGLAIFYYLISLHEKREDNCSSGYENHYVQTAKNNMHFNINQPISITKIAHDIGISDRYLYNLFIKHEGIAPKKYMNLLRINNAKALLESDNYTITEIAESIGFSDVMAFSAFFSKHVGTSPSEYRKDNKKKGELLWKNT